MTTFNQLFRETIPAEWDSEHMRRTPDRFQEMLIELTTPEKFEFTKFKNTNGIDEMIVIKDIQFYSLCAHHVVPFFGRAHVAYIPQGWIAGLSKFARLVKNRAKGLWVQEELTYAVATDIQSELEPIGVGVVLEAEHLCMSMRGVQAPGTNTTTSTMLGAFGDHDRLARTEFLSLIRSR